MTHGMRYPWRLAALVREPAGNPLGNVDITLYMRVPLLNKGLTVAESDPLGLYKLRPTVGTVVVDVLGTGLTGSVTWSGIMRSCLSLSADLLPG
ncbi:hypothetical protein F2P81_012698 [Scophthalmus maximus]|uniref:Uncharacterized protein n=1 Tax=Scophthalmus maximus TaxID=52904 RepID=A0A6A4SST2_SCOMX|nr:hypothetical protein F2P81_012698 [Scophthalmus maximus]